MANGKTKDFHRTIASVHWIHSAQISSWMQFWFVRVKDLRNLNEN